MLAPISCTLTSRQHKVRSKNKKLLFLLLILCGENGVIRLNRKEQLPCQERQSKKQAQTLSRPSCLYCWYSDLPVQPSSASSRWVRSTSRPRSCRHAWTPRRSRTGVPALLSAPIKSVRCVTLPRRSDTLDGGAHLPSYSSLGRSSWTDCGANSKKASMASGHGPKT